MNSEFNGASTLPKAVKEIILMMCDVDYKESRSNSEVEEAEVNNYYANLKCQMEHLNCQSEEYGVVSEYLKNTQHHVHYKLDLIDVIKLQRHEEEAKFKGSCLGNRALLWHGSRTVNFKGILSQGLRIAPTEAIFNGASFGNGIYFADIVTKSANYCRVEKGGEGLLLLCDVALGRIKEEFQMIVRGASHEYDSVKGIGLTIPDPKSVKSSPEGYKIPLGKTMASSLPEDVTLSLLYNEYIVYNTDQIKMKYLVRVKFVER